MSMIKMLFIGICLIPVLGCNNSTEPSSPKDITDFANHYELVYAYQNEIHTILSTGGNYQQLTSDNIYDHEPVWSPDGTQIVFVSTREGDLDIFIMDKDGSNLTRLTQNAESSQSARFSPDGQQLLYRSGGVLFVMDKDGSNNRAITTSNWQHHNLQLWSPDGKSVVFEDLAFDEIGQPDKIGDEPDRRRAINIERRRLLYDETRIHNRDHIGHGQRFQLIMGDIDGGDAETLYQIANFGPGFFAKLGVQIGQRLVEQQ